MDDLMVRKGGWCVLLFCCLAGCTSPPERLALPNPLWPLPSSEPTIESCESDRQIFKHADFPAYDRMETPPRLPNPDGIDASQWKMMWTIRDCEDPKPNFAGRFMVFTHGCGSGCHTINFIDLSTGVWRRDLDMCYQLYMAPESRFKYSFGHSLHVDSRLLTIRHLGDLGEGCYYYEFTDDRFELLHYDAWDTSWNRGETPSS